MVKNAEMLAEAGIRLLAVDFDLTLVNIHTGGGWRQNAEQLARRVRPGMKKLIQTSMANGVHVAIVTFSPQVKLISEVLALTFPSLSPKVPSLLLVLSLLGRRYREQIVVRGLDDSWPYHGDGTGEGKQPHMASVAEELACQRSTFVSRDSTLLIDDDYNNIEVALRHGVNAILCSPQDPTSVDRGLDILLSHRGLLPSEAVK